ncbi:MAG: glycosyltransferase family 39 protein [Polyangiaceae bacterium]
MGDSDPAGAKAILPRSVDATAARFFPWAVLVFAACFFAQCLWFIRTNGPTIDEPGHLVEGVINLRTRSFSVGDWHPPLPRLLAAIVVDAVYAPPLPPYQPERMFGAAAEFVGAQFVHSEGGPGVVPLMTVARLPAALLGIVTVVITGLWARRLWGPFAGCVALALVAFEPTLIAHSSLVTQDGPLTTFSVLAMFFATACTTRPTWTNVIGLCASCAGALACKHTAVALAFAIGAALLVDAIASRRGKAHLRALLGRLSALVGGALVAAAVVYLVYAKKALHSTDVVTTWFDGLRRQVFDHRRDAGHVAFLFGQVTLRGFRSYFFWTLAFKVPIGTLALYVASLVLAGRGHRLTRSHFGFFVLAPYLFVAVMTWARIHTGVRMILPVFPAMIVLASRVATIEFDFPIRRWLALGLPLAWNVVGVMRVAPHDIAYFNEFAGGPKAGGARLNDSNLDWGQDLPALARYVASRGNPPIYLAYFGSDLPTKYGLKFQRILRSPEAIENVAALGSRPELVAVSMFYLMGNNLGPNRLAWLQRKPYVADIGYSIRVYDITDDADAHLELARLYTPILPVARVEALRALEIEPANQRALTMLKDIDAALLRMP